VGSALLEDLVSFYGRFLSVPSPAYLDVLAAWTAHTHAVGASYQTPRLAVLSAEKQSAKTRVLELLELTCRRARHSISMSSSYLFRRIDRDAPTLLIDEADTIFGPKADSAHDDIRAIVNAGHRRGATVGRCIGEGSRQEPVDFGVFCPVALAGIGTLPDTIIDRSIVLQMRKRRPDETVEPFQHADVLEEGHLLRRRLAAWAKRQEDRLRGHRPSMPPGIVDRPADVWAPVIVVADIADDTWPQRIRRACVNLQAERAGAGVSVGVRLLADIRDVFSTLEADRFSSETLVLRLTMMEESDWGEWGRARKPITPVWLAKRLRPYGIRPRTIRTGDTTPKGYLRDDFLDAWERYLPPTADSDDPQGGTDPS
jgi:hypothetical protein